MGILGREGVVILQYLTGLHYKTLSFENKKRKPFGLLGFFSLQGNVHQSCANVELWAKYLMVTDFGVCKGRVLGFSAPPVLRDEQV